MTSWGSSSQMAKEFEVYDTHARDVAAGEGEVTVRVAHNSAQSTVVTLTRDDTLELMTELMAYLLRGRPRG